MKLGIVSLENAKSHNRAALTILRSEDDKAETMRILQIIDSLGAGGKERQFVELLKGLKREPGIETRVVVMSDLIRYDEFRDLDIPTDILARRGRFDLGVFWRLHRLLRDFAPTIVHSWNGMCSVYAAPSARLIGSVFVNGYVRDARPEIPFFDRISLQGRLSRPFSDVVVANSRAGLAAYRVPPARSACIYNGFDWRRTKQMVSASELCRALNVETPFIVGMVGAFDRHKDYDTFLGAAARVSTMREDVTFLAVGDGSRLASYQAAYPPSRYPRIRFLGYRSDVEDLINVFTVGVLTSEGEGIANAIMECMALAKPVVATAAGGNSEIVVSGETGYLIDTRDVEALGNRIVELIDDPEKVKRFGAAGRARIESAFSLERMTSDYLALYRRLIARRR